MLFFFLVVVHVVNLKEPLDIGLADEVVECWEGKCPWPVVRA